MTLSATLIPHASADLDERGSVLRGAEREQQNARTTFDAIDTVGDDCVESAQLFAARAGDDLGDPFRGVGHARGRHRTKPLVVVIVTVENEIDVVVVQDLPDRSDLRSLPCHPELNRGLCQ